MRDLRVLAGWLIEGYSNSYNIPFEGRTLRVIATPASDPEGEGWDHVSVSLEGRTPNWREMEHVKRMFFKEDEWAMQLHAPPAKHISIHPYVLHLWRPSHQPIPIPGEVLV